MQRAITPVLGYFDGNSHVVDIVRQAQLAHEGPGLVDLEEQLDR